MQRNDGSPVKRRIANACVIGLLVVAGSALASGASHRLDQRLAERLTLRRADLPSGWQAESKSKPKPSSHSCGSLRSFRRIETGRAATSFGSGSIRLAISGAAVMPTLATATEVFGRAARNVRSCLKRTPNVTSVAALSFQPFGDQSEAWRMSVKLSRGDIHFDFILVRFDFILVRIRRAVAAYLFTGIGFGLEVNLVRKATGRA